ncbi:AAA family ATPase [Kamptonema sp. UHCC 0994]|uniref:AAA family ATPase n=1 Tax=Kamptonema sp. UHCC 0994 TaxID=3031329 RepID=UPI0023B8DB80|nr:AAA family ATPase [Kamptonema sp. UHCC 0994]MDF0552240.1 AAA family ATPase [Kamptonema sp. UHCC 0994]
MNAEEAFNVLNAIFIKTSGGLTQLEKDIFFGIWNDKTYPQISNEIYKSEIHIKETSSSLFEKIEAIFGIQGIKKKNLRSTLEQILKQTSPVTSIELPTDALQLLNFNNNFLVTNPFVPRSGSVDDPQLFFPRPKEIRNIFETLKGGSSVALIGERGIGKSSLLMEICRQAETQFGQTRKPIYVNLQNVHDEDDFYEALCSLVGVQTNKGYLLERALKPHRILLILDEVEKMTWDGFTNNVRGQLRGLADGINPPLRLVVAACSPLDVLFPDSQDKNMTSPFKGICLEENLDLWDQIICRNFIDSRLKAPWLTPVTNSVSFTEEEIARIIAESGGHPQKLMQLCYQIYAGYLEEIQ